MELGAVTGNVRSNRIAWESVCGGVVKGLKESGFPMRTKRLFISVVAALGLSALCLSAPASAGAPTASGAGHDQLAAADKSNFTAVRWGRWGGGRHWGGGWGGRRIGYWGGGWRRRGWYGGYGGWGLPFLGAGLYGTGPAPAGSASAHHCTQYNDYNRAGAIAYARVHVVPYGASCGFHRGHIVYSWGCAGGLCATSVDQQPFTVTVPTEALAFRPWRFRSNFFTFAQ